jgi:hypothetical protein
MIKWLLEKKLKNGKPVWAKDRNGRCTPNANDALKYKDEQYALSERMYSPGLQEFYPTEHEWPEEDSK